MTPEEKAKRKAYHEAHKEERRAYNKAYYVAHKEQMNAYSKAYREAYKEELKAKKKAYLARHGGVHKARCRRYNKTHKQERRARVLQQTFGLSLGEYSLLGSNANWSCEICGKRDEVLHVDHCHRTGKIRGLLCSSCNHLLGYAYDNSEILCKAIAYLQKLPVEFNWPSSPDVDWDALCK